MRKPLDFLARDCEKRHKITTIFLFGNDFSQIKLTINNL